MEVGRIRRRQVPYHSTDLFGGVVLGRFFDADFASLRVVDAENQVTLSGIGSQPSQIPLRDVKDQLPAWGQVATHACKTLLQVFDSEQVQQRVAWNQDGREPSPEIELAHIRLHERYL